MSDFSITKLKNGWLVGTNTCAEMEDIYFKTLEQAISFIKKLSKDGRFE